MCNEFNNVRVKGEIWLVMFSYPVQHIDLVHFEAENLHENDLIHLSAVNIAISQKVLAEADAIFKPQDDCLTDYER